MTSPTDGGGATYRVLIVDDTPAIHDDFRKIFAPRPKDDGDLASLEAALFEDDAPVVVQALTTFELSSAYQGLEAVDTLADALADGRPFSLAFVDMRMPPGIDGLETIQRLWKIDPDLQVVICTAYSDHTWGDLHARLGQRDNLLILRKPFDPMEALQCAHAMTAKWTVLRQLQQHLRDLETTVYERTEELKRSEDQLRQVQKLEAIGQLAGGVAHDFNNLLGVIQANVDFLSEEHGDTEEVTEIADAVQRGARLVRQLLAFSKSRPRTSSVVAPNTTLRELDKMLRRILGEHISMKQTLAGDLASIRGDAGQLEQVIVNLVVNARDAMPDGGSLAIETQNAAIDDTSALRLGVTAGHYVSITVRDTGCGMDEATRARVFEPFFTTKPVGRGTGLGLATVFGIVQQDHGAIEIESEVGVGSTFRVYLPAVDEAPIAATAASTKAPRRGQETILVVEDEDQVRRALVKLLKSWGYTCVEASNGDAAMVMLLSTPSITLAITDLVMPGTDGRTLAARLRAERPGLVVMLMSGYTQHSSVRTAPAPGELFIAKPFVAAQLSDALRVAFERRGTTTIVPAA